MIFSDSGALSLFRGGLYKSLESCVIFSIFQLFNFWPGPGFEPVTSRVAGRRCPCILSHLTHLNLLKLDDPFNTFLEVWMTSLSIC